jgi:branched-chain amino acid transport system permease protein
VNGITTLPKRYFLPVLLSGLILLGTMPVYSSPYVIILFISIFMYAILAVSWATFCSPTGYISLATSAFFGVGVYTSAILQALPLPVVSIIAGSMSFLFGLLVGVTTLRLRGMYFCVFTFGLGELLRHALIWYEVNITGTVGRWLPLLSPVTVYYYMLGILVVAVLCAYFIRRSKYGLALQSIGQSEEAASHIGINVNMVKIIIFAITCSFMGAVGAVMATRWSYVDPDLAFAPFLSFFVIMTVLVGGMKSTIYGPLLGASILTVVSDRVLAEFPRHTMLLFGIILIAVIVFLPNGLVGLMRLRRSEKGVATGRGGP